MLGPMIWAFTFPCLSFAGPIYGSQRIENPYLLPRENSVRDDADLTNYLSPIASSSSNYGDAPELAFTLKKHKSWQWGGDGAWANITCVSTSDDMKYLAVEGIDSVIQDLQCTDTGISFTFTDQDSYDSAQSAWGWIGEGDNRVIVAVLAKESCNSDGDRHPYNVTQVEFSDNLAVTFVSTPAEWHEILGDYKMSLAPTSGSVERRGSSSGFASFDNSFAKSDILSKDVNGVTLGLGCDPCSVSGGVNIDFDASLSDGATLSIQSVGLGAQIGLALSASGTLDTEFDESMTIVSLPIGPLAISALGVKVGPVLEVLATLAITNISAEVQISMGASIEIEDSSWAWLQLPSFESSASGWGTTFSPIGPSLSGEVSASLSFFPTIALQLACEFPLFDAFTAGVGLNTPQFDVSGAVSIDSDGGVCDNSGSAGVSLEVDVQGTLQVFGGFGEVDVANPEHAFVLTATSTQLFSTCMAVATTPAVITEVLVGSCTSAVFGGTSTQFACQAPTPFNAGLNCQPDTSCDDGDNGCLLVPYGDTQITAVCGSEQTNSVRATATASPY
ncbi:hypothetical protein LTR17_003372 [Elasticomyces elasticus]|nr:hypothetical protein LTR17_003372 [Elasticomyces elasticus]